MISYKSSLYLPVSVKNILTTQIKCDEYIELQKILLEDNDRQIANSFDELIGSHTRYCNVKDLTCVDKFIILCNIRAISCGNVLTFTADEIQQTIRIDQIIEKCLMMYHKVEYEITHKGLKHTLNYPFDLYIESAANVIENIIEKFGIANSCNVDFILLRDLTGKEKEKVLNSINLPSAEIDKFFKSVDDVSTLDIVKESKALNIHGISVNPFNNSMLNFLKFIYRDNLLMLHKNIYTLANRCGLSPQYILTLPPAELQMYTQFYSEEVEEQNKKLQANKPSVNMPYVKH